jgi:hypothetical protein
MSSTASTASTTTRRSRATRAADQATTETTTTDVKPDPDAVRAALEAAGLDETAIAKVVKSITPKPPKLNSRKIVASALVKVAADMVETWDHAEVSAEDARNLVSKWLGYIPASEWDDRLAPRSDAGRRPKNGETETDEADETE